MDDASYHNIELAWDEEKEQKNVRKHKLDFSIAGYIISDPLGLMVYDRFEEGEHRWHTFARVGSKTLLVVHTDLEISPVRIIGLREATPPERKRYEEGDSG